MQIFTSRYYRRGHNIHLQNLRSLERKGTHQIPPENLDEINVDIETDTNTEKFQTPRKFSTNFVKVIRQKAVRSLNLKNRYEVLSETESETEDERKDTSETQGGNKNNPLPKPKAKPANTTENTTKVTKKSAMPLIVVEGTTDNHVNLKRDPKNISLGPYTVKYTANSTILFVEQQISQASKRQKSPTTGT